MSKKFNRRTDTEPVQVGDYYDGARRYYDQNLEMTVVKLFSGDCYATRAPDEMLVTILGSCIAACIRDPVVGCAGMNHFLLPGDPGTTSNTLGDAARYGAFAMEQLINKLLAMGAQKSRLEIKLFGGGNVIDSSAMIGTKNITFVKQFLAKEGLRVEAGDMGGDTPRRVHYYSGDGRVMLRKLRRKEDMRVVQEEREYEQSITGHSEGSIELFG